MQILIYFTLALLGVIIGMMIQSFLDAQSFAEYIEKVRELKDENKKLKEKLSAHDNPPTHVIQEFVISDDTVGKKVDFGGF
jgi:hypothetical protein